MWAQLPKEGREQYHAAAKVDRERWLQQLHEHQARSRQVRMRCVRVG